MKIDKSLLSLSSIQSQGSHGITIMERIELAGWMGSAIVAQVKAVYPLTDGLVQAYTPLPKEETEAAFAKAWVPTFSFTFNDDGVGIEAAITVNNLSEGPTFTRNFATVDEFITAVQVLDNPA